MESRRRDGPSAAVSEAQTDCILGKRTAWKCQGVGRGERPAIGRDTSWGSPVVRDISSMGATRLNQMA
jgi:hypothetical protein